MTTHIDTLIIPAHDNESHNGFVHGRALREFDESTRAVANLRSELHDMDLLLEYNSPLMLRCTHEDLPEELGSLDLHISNGGQVVTMIAKNAAARQYLITIKTIDDSRGQVYPKGA